MEDLKLLLPTSVRSPSPRTSKRYVRSTSPSNNSRASSDTSTDQREKKEDIEKIIRRPIKDNGYHEHIHLHMLPRKTVPASDSSFNHSSQSTNITADAIGVYEREEPREDALKRPWHLSQKSLLIGAKGLNGLSRPPVRIKTRVSATHQIQDTNKTKDTTKMENTNDHRQNNTRQRSSRSHTTRARRVSTSADDEDISLNSVPENPSEKFRAHIAKESETRLQYADQDSVRSGTLKSSINANPSLLKTIDNLFRRLIRPELELLRLEQKQEMRESRKNVDQDNKEPVNSDSSGLPAIGENEQVHHTSTPSISQKPKVNLYRDEYNAGIQLSGDPIKSRKKDRRMNNHDLASMAVASLEEHSRKRKRREERRLKGLAVYGGK